MRYNISARLIYDATDGTLTLPESNEPDSQLSITSSALLYFFLCNPQVISRDDVLKRVWDDNGLTSSNANLNQYLSMLRKTFRLYDIDNIIITVSRGYLQLNPDIAIEQLDLPPQSFADAESFSETPGNEHEPPVVLSRPLSAHERGVCWYIAGVCLLTIAVLLVFLSSIGSKASHPITLTQMPHGQCEIVASDEMLRSVSGTIYGKNFDAVRQGLDLACKPGERFVFFYGDRLDNHNLGRVFLAHCASHEDNPFGYCDNYFYYSWKS
ncbi:transcriptional regulator [Erwinia sorbitola]|uniref:Winged helix family transcriptional regulator n=1 Tax=Erwinia sorbitola TaxID=2681984 RepID=A0ABW9RC23_9GAMM|nr:helix-turn-helix domain-containing protein [Erwinia sorbitola]MTD26986.1 winged helix family transcriptional regulator [Erwinia sorbitola]